MKVWENFPNPVLVAKPNAGDIVTVRVQSTGAGRITTNPRGYTMSVRYTPAVTVADDPFIPGVLRAIGRHDEKDERQFYQIDFGIPFLCPWNGTIEAHGEDMALVGSRVINIFVHTTPTIIYHGGGLIERNLLAFPPTRLPTYTFRPLGIEAVQLPRGTVAVTCDPPGPPFTGIMAQEVELNVHGEPFTAPISVFPISIGDGAMGTIRSTSGSGIKLVTCHLNIG